MNGFAFADWLLEPISEEGERMSSDVQLLSQLDDCNNPTIGDGFHFDSFDLSINEKHIRSIDNSQSTVCVKVKKQNRRISKQKEIAQYKAFNVVILAARCISSNTRFYLFADQIVDINYLRFIVNTDDNEPLPLGGLFRNFKKVSYIVHRADQRYLEIFTDRLEKDLADISPVIKMIKSLGNARLHELSLQIEQFWQGIKGFQRLIQGQYLIDDFRCILDARRAACQQRIKLITSLLDPNRFIMYNCFRANYMSGSYENIMVGYSPALFELMAGSAAQFKEYSTRNGYQDPISLKRRLELGFKDAMKYIKKKVLEEKMGEKKPDATSECTVVDDYQVELLTFDSFLISARQHVIAVNLDKEFDDNQGVLYPVHDTLGIIEFFIDERGQEELTNMRESRNNKRSLKYLGEEIEAHKLTIMRDDNSQAIEEFIQKFYAGDITQLIEKDNKLNKRCGIIDKKD